MASGKGFPRSLDLGGGINADSEGVSSGATTLDLSFGAYEKLVTSGGTAGNEIVELPLLAAQGIPIGARCLVTFAAEGNAADVVRINAQPADGITSDGMTDGANTGRTNVDLDTVGEFALFENKGGDEWNVVYTTGAVS